MRIVDTAKSINFNPHLSKVKLSDNLKLKRQDYYLSGENVDK